MDRRRARNRGWGWGIGEEEIIEECIGTLVVGRGYGKVGAEG